MKKRGCIISTVTGLLYTTSLPAMAHIADSHDLGVIGLFHFLTAIEHVIWFAPVVIILLLITKRRNSMHHDSVR